MFSTMSSKDISFFKNFLIRHEKILTGIILALLCVLVLMRISIWTIADFGFVDARYFVETARLILHGISPYNPETNPTPFKYPLQAPSMSFLSMPLCFLPNRFLAYFFFYLGGILAFFCFTFLVFHYYGFHIRDYIRLRWKNLPIWIVLFMIFSSSPFLFMLKHGQNSSMAAFFLFLALLFPKRDKQSNIIFLGLAAAIKYSLLITLAPVLLIQKRLRLCIFSFLLFLFMVLVVGFWLDGIIPAIREYINLIIMDTKSGANSYSNKTSLFFTHVGFFRYQPVNTLIKGFLLVPYALALRIIYLRGKKEPNAEADNAGGIPGVTALEWGAFTTLMMTISYHRSYDCILFVPFLGIIFLEMVKKVCREAEFKTFNLFWVLGSAGLLLFWTMPLKLVYAAETWIGSIFPGGQDVFYYSINPFNGLSSVMFPLSKFVMIGTTVFLFALELLHSSDFSTGTLSQKEKTE